jgi:hypothetical protein
VELGDSLAASLRNLRPASRAEPELARWRSAFMLVGGFPELLTGARAQADLDESSRLLESQQVLRSDAVERAIYKDIPQSFGVDNPMMLERLLYVLAAQLAGLLSPTKICGELGLKAEVDLIYDQHDEPLAFEIGSSPEHARSGLRALVERHPRFDGRCYLVGPQVAVTRPSAATGGIGTVPLDLFLDLLGHQSAAAVARNLGVSTRSA